MTRTAAEAPAGAIALRCAGLVKRYGSVVAVDGLDLEVRTGECFGLLGPNGAGKTTTIEILEGLTPHDAGEVEVLGHRWGRHDRALRAASRHSAAGDATERQALGRGDAPSVPLLLHTAPQYRRRARDRRARVEAERLGREALRRPEATARRRRAPLSADPDVLFLDEPTTGLDPAVAPPAMDVARDIPARGRHDPAHDALHGRGTERSVTALPWSITDA